MAFPSISARRRRRYTAAAALVDSALANTAGAKPFTDIKANVLRARIE